MANLEGGRITSELIPSGTAVENTNTQATFEDIISPKQESRPSPRWMDDMLKSQAILSPHKNLTANKNPKRHLNTKKLHLDLSRLTAQGPTIPLPRARFGMHPPSSQLNLPAGSQRTTLRYPQLFGYQNEDKKMKSRGSALSLKIPTTQLSKSAPTTEISSTGNLFKIGTFKDTLNIHSEVTSESEFPLPRKLLSCSSACSGLSTSSCTSSSSSSESLDPAFSSSTSPLVPSDSTGEDICDESDFVSTYNAYPKGPVCVLEPNLYLYSEPTVDQINKFDVVINVAQEITNYSMAESSIQSSDPVLRDVEYYFIPWNHNSRLHSDFIKLTKVIDDSLIANKKVLIHCQCGVSRSASLILAYFMRAFHLDYSEAYERLKKHAPSISPNLSLIYELMEWGRYLENQDNFNAQN